MTTNSASEIDSLKQAISVLEGQRALLGDAVVETALEPLREKLARLETATESLVATKPAPSGEQRKLVTVLFADLVGFTAMSERLDPEDVRDITNTYFKRWSTLLEQFGGVVEKFIGDAVMAVFGMAAAGENDPENAIAAALAMRDGLKALNEELAASAVSSEGSIQLRMRIGIHTGQVVVSWLGERKGQDFLVVGDTVNLASRLQALAPVNGILITHDTYRHVRGLFDVQVVEPVAVKGKQDPVQTYVILQAKPRSFRRKLEGVEGVDTAMIGRDAELARLQTFFQQVAAQRRCQVVYILGEAGIGKSRLLLEFDHWLETTTDYYFFNGRASPNYLNVPFGLLRDVFANRFGIQDSDAPEVLRNKLAAGLAEAFTPPALPAEEFRSAPNHELEMDQADRVEMMAHFIGRLLGFSFGESAYLNAVEPRQVLERGLSYLNDYFSAIAGLDPAVILLEDLHWADDSTLDTLERLEDSLANLPLLIVCTARPALLERRPALGETQANRSNLFLDPLPPTESRRQVETVLQKVQDLPTELIDLIVHSAEGNPFYVEELIKMLLEDGVLIAGDETWQVSSRRLASLQVPATLIEVLQARFDSLSAPEKALLQKAAVVGRTFWDQTLTFMLAQEVPPGSALPDLVQQETEMLGRLIHRELVYNQGDSTFENTREFLFKHALLRDVTYASLLKNYRRVYHAHTARWLEEVAGRSQRAEEFAALIAEHFQLAGEGGLALDRFFRAARQAQERFANREALYLYEQALALTTAQQVGLTVDILLGQVEIQGLLGNREEQLRLFARLDEQLALIPDSHQAAAFQAKVLYQRAVYEMQTGDYSASIESASQAAALAQMSSDLVLEARAQSIWAGNYRYLADYSRAREHYELTGSLGQKAGLINLQANALMGMGVVCETQAEYSQARAFLEEALVLYRQSQDQLGESRALNSLGVVETNLGAVDSAISHLNIALELKHRMGDRFGLGVTLCNLGVVMERRSDFEMAIQYFQESLEISEDIADGEGKEAALIGIGNNQLAVGQYRQARQTLEAALVISREIEDLQGEADILTSLGDIEIADGEIQRGVELCRGVIALTKEIGAPSEMAYAWYYLGRGMERLGSIQDAEAAYRNSLDLRQESGQHSQAIDALCGLARAALIAGDPAAAANYAAQALQSPGWEYGLSEPALAYLTCFQALSSTDPARATTALQTGQSFVQRIAEQIRSPELRSSYLENVASNRALLAEAARLDQSPPPVSSSA